MVEIAVKKANTELTRLLMKEENLKSTGGNSKYDTLESIQEKRR